MQFQFLFLVGACLLASSTAIIMPRDQLTNPLSSLKKLQERIPVVPGPVDANEDVETFLNAWFDSAMVSTIDNKQFEDETVVIDGSELAFQNTHVRGVHRLKNSGDGKRQVLNNIISILTFTAISNSLEFHSDLIHRSASGSSLEMRSSATIKNLNIYVAVKFNSVTSEQTIEYLSVIGTPDVHVAVKTLDSQWGEPSSAETKKIMDQVEDYIKTTYIPKLLNEFLGNSKNTVNHLMDVYLKQNWEIFDKWGDAPTHFINYRKKLCPSYKLGLNHTLEFGHADSDKMIISNGVIRGLDYLKRTKCKDEQECFTVPCGTDSPSQFIYDFDEIYIDYDLVAYVNGASHAGKTTVTISGLQGTDHFTCIEDCWSVPWWCLWYLNSYLTTFPREGKVLVDVEGLPEEFRPFHGDLIAFAENTHGKFIDLISGGHYNVTAHFDHNRCEILN